MELLLKNKSVSWYLLAIIIGLSVGVISLAQTWALSILAAGFCIFFLLYRQKLMSMFFPIMILAPDLTHWGLPYYLKPYWGVILLLMFSYWLTRWRKQQTEPVLMIEINLFDLLYIIYIIINLVSVLANEGLTARAFMSYFYVVLPFFAYYFMTRNLVSLDELLALRRHLLWPGFFCLLLGIIQHVNPSFLQSISLIYVSSDKNLEDILGYGNRAVSTFGNPNQFGIFVTMLGVMALSWMFQANIKKSVKFILFVYYLLSLYAVVSSSSRTGLIAFVVSSGVVLFLLRKFKLLAMFVLLGMIGWEVGNFSDSSQLTTLLRLSSGGTLADDTSWLSRLDMWSYMWQLILDHPFLGYGVSIFKTENLVVDSEFIQQFVQGGVLGGGLFLGFLIYWVVVVLKKIRKLQSEVWRHFMIGLMGVYLTMIMCFMTGDFLSSERLGPLVLAILGMGLVVVKSVES